MWNKFKKFWQKNFILIKILSNIFLQYNVFCILFPNYVYDVSDKEFVNRIK